MVTNYSPDNSSYGGVHATNVMHWCWSARSVDSLVAAAVVFGAAGCVVSVAAAHFGASHFLIYPKWMGVDDLWMMRQWMVYVERERTTKECVQTDEQSCNVYEIMKLKA